MLLLGFEDADHLAERGSRVLHVVATWIRPAKDTDADGQPIVMKSGLHRTFFEDSTATLARAGNWHVFVQESIEAAAARLGVAVPTSPVGGGYWLTAHALRPLLK